MGKAQDTIRSLDAQRITELKQLEEKERRDRVLQVSVLEFTVQSLQADLARAQDTIRLLEMQLTSPIPTAESKRHAVLLWDHVEQLVLDAPKLGEGGFGPVYRSCLEGKDMAVKILSERSEQGLEQFHKEVQLLTLLKHPNIIELVGTAHGHASQMAIVYPLAEHGSLDTHLASSEFPWTRRLACTHGIVQGLSYMHKGLVMYCDLKPQNVLLFGDDWVPKLSDLGISRLCPELGVGHSHVTSRRIVGSFGYVAPEVMQNASYSPAADVYALGLILLQLLFGMESLSDGRRMIQQLTLQDSCLQPPFPSDVGGALHRLAQACTQQFRNERPTLASVDYTLRQIVRESRQPLQECVVCMDAAREVRFSCGHKLVCEACAHGLQHCPVCRERLTGFHRDQVSQTFMALARPPGSDHCEGAP